VFNFQLSRYSSDTDSFRQLFYSLETAGEMVDSVAKETLNDFFAEMEGEDRCG
jgi:hypothetical protein